MLLSKSDDRKKLIFELIEGGIRRELYRKQFLMNGLFRL
jgi:hypothetical protein